VIHRDMSPGNVVLDYDGNVKIVDFGIAKVLAVGVEKAESVKGKLSYMAPEQAMGGRMDGRADQYALGVIAYEALSGVRPNDGAHEGETLNAILGGKHTPLHERTPGLPPSLNRIVERMLATRPADRFANMEVLLDALAELTPKLTVHRSLAPS
jgi:eukaryotic-like serine/threonine-protein kinase